MPTIVVKSIGTAGRDYSTLQAWEDACPANLVTVDQIWKGEAYNDSNFTATLTLAGTTTDATHYKWLTAAAGQSIFDNVANPMRADATKGVNITGGFGYATAIDADGEAYFRLDRFQTITSAGNSRSLYLASNSWADRCIFSGGGYNAGVVALNRSGSGAVLSNSLVMLTASYGGTGGATQQFGNSQVLNCTLFAAPGISSTTPMTMGYANGGAKNVIAIGFGTGPAKAGNSSSYTFTNCYCDSTTALSGWTGGIAFSTANFVNVTAGSYDFRLAAGSVMRNAGTRVIDTYTTKDAYGRPRGTVVDIGASQATVTTVTKTIGTASRDYSTIQAWDDAAPANLITSETIWQGVIYNDSTFLPGARTTIGGSTSDPARYKSLTVAAGQSAFDNTANALAYDASKGAALFFGAGYNIVLEVTEKGFHLSRLQISSNTGSNPSAMEINADYCVIDSCLFDGGNVKISGQYSVVTNVAATMRGASNFSVGGDNWVMQNCTWIDSGYRGQTLGNNYWSGVVKNCYFGSYDDQTKNPISRPLQGTWINCACSHTTGYPTGMTPNVPFSTANFMGVGLGSFDLRLTSGSALKDAGVSDLSVVSKDIYGTARPQGSAVDIGAVEYASAGPSPITGTLTQTLAAATLSSASTMASPSSRTAAAAITLGALTSSSATTLQIKAALAATLAPATLVATNVAPSVALPAYPTRLGYYGIRPVTPAYVTRLGSFVSVAAVSASARTAVLTQTLGTLTGTSTGLLPIKADAAQTLGALTVVAPATLQIKAVTASTLAGVTIVAPAKIALAATTTRTLAAVTVVAPTKIALKAVAAPTLAAVTSVAPAKLALTATSAVTLGALTSASTGVLPIVASAAGTLGAATLVSAGSLQGVGQGNLTQTLAGATVAATATLPLVGALAQTLAGVTPAAAGALPLTGTLAQTLAPIGVASAASGAVAGTLASTLAAATVASTGVSTNNGTLTSTLAPASVTATGLLPLSGSAGITLGAATLTGASTLALQATAAGTLDAVTLTSASTLQGVGQGNVTATLGALTGTSAAKLAIAASAAPTLAALASTATAALALRATTAGTLDAATVAATGTLAALAISGTTAQTLAPATIAASAVLPVAATAAGTLAAATSVAAGTLPLRAAGAPTLADVTLVSASTITAPAGGNVAQVLAPATVVSTGKLPLVAAGAPTLADTTSSATATTSIKAALTQTLGSVTAGATGAVKITATLATTLGGVTLTAAGSAVNVSTGTLAATLANAVVAAAAKLQVQGQAAGTLADASIVSTALITLKGTAAATLENVKLTAAATSAIRAALAQTLADVSSVSFGGNTGWPYKVGPSFLTITTVVEGLTLSVLTENLTMATAHESLDLILGSVGESLVVTPS